MASRIGMGTFRVMGAVSRRQSPAVLRNLPPNTSRRNSRNQAALKAISNQQSSAPKLAPTSIQPWQPNFILVGEPTGPFSLRTVSEPKEESNKSSWLAKVAAAVAGAIAVNLLGQKVEKKIFSEASDEDLQAANQAIYDRERAFFLSKLDEFNATEAELATELESANTCLAEYEQELQRTDSQSIDHLSIGSQKKYKEMQQDLQDKINELKNNIEVIQRELTKTKILKEFAEREISSPSVSHDSWTSLAPSGKELGVASGDATWATAIDSMIPNHGKYVGALAAFSILIALLYPDQPLSKREIENLLLESHPYGQQPKSLSNEERNQHREGTLTHQKWRTVASSLSAATLSILLQSKKVAGKIPFSTVWAPLAAVALTSVLFKQAGLSGSQAPIATLEDLEKNAEQREGLLEKHVVGLIERGHKLSHEMKTTLQETKQQLERHKAKREVFAKQQVDAEREAERQQKMAQTPWWKRAVTRGYEMGSSIIQSVIR